jgi:hypothetical protein
MADFPTFPQPVVERVVSGHRGANSRQFPWLIEENQFAQLENVTIDRFGRVRRRGGTTAFGGRPELPGGIGKYVDNDEIEFMLGVWGNDVYRSQGDSGWAQIATDVSLQPDLLHQFVPIRVGVNQAVAVGSCEQTTTKSQLSIYDVDSDAVTQASLFPRCIAAFQNRLFAGDADTLHWSEIAAPVAFSNANNLLIEPGVGGKITALFPTREENPRMLIFKEDLIAVFEPKWGASSSFIATAGDALDTITSKLRVLNPDVGCVATKSVVEVSGFEDGDILFLAKDGVRAIRRSATDSQAGAGLPVSYDIPDYIDRINFSKAYRAAATFYDNAYHLAVPMDGSASNSHILRFDLQTKGWSLQNIGAKDVMSGRFASSHRCFLQSPLRTNDTSVTNAVGDATLPHQLFQLYSSSKLDPAASKINWRVASRAFAGKDMGREKRWDSLKLLMSSGDTAIVEVGYKLNQGPTLTTATAVVTGSAAGSVVLGVDPLPWQATDAVLRQFPYNLADIDPGYIFQVELGSVTSASDFGQVSLYFMEFSSFPQQNKFEADS